MHIIKNNVVDLYQQKQTVMEILVSKALLIVEKEIYLNSLFNKIKKMDIGDNNYLHVINKWQMCKNELQILRS